MSTHSGGARPGTMLAERTSSGVAVAVTREARETLGRFFGRDLSDHEVASLVGALPGSSVSVRSDPHFTEAYFHVTGANSQYVANRLLARDARSGLLVMENDSLDVRRDMQGRGLGTRLFAAQVQGLAALGVTRIVTTAMRSARAVGYYTWARLGYDGPIRLLPGTTVPTRFARATTVQQLLALPGGAAWWKEHGNGFPGTFDLARGSTSRRVLAAYLRQRRNR